MPCHATPHHGFQNKTAAIANAHGKGYEALQGIAQSTAQALPFNIAKTNTAGTDGADEVASSGFGFGNASSFDFDAPPATSTPSSFTSSASSTPLTVSVSRAPVASSSQQPGLQRSRSAGHTTEAAGMYHWHLAWHGNLFYDNSNHVHLTILQSGGAGKRHSMYVESSSRAGASGAAAGTGARRGSLYSRPTRSSQERENQKIHSNTSNLAGGGVGAALGSPSSVGRKRQLQDMETTTTLTPTRNGKRVDRGRLAIRKMKAEAEKKQRAIVSVPAVIMTGAVLLVLRKHETRKSIPASIDSFFTTIQEEAQQEAEKKKVQQREIMLNAKKQSNASLRVKKRAAK